MDITTLGYQNFPCTSYSPTGEIRTNENILLFGSTGTGKSHYFVRKQLQEFYGSYVVVDVNHTIYNEYAQYYEMNKWHTQVIDFSAGPKVAYNPFLYVKDDDTLHQFVNIVLGRHIYPAGNDITSNFSKYSEDALFCMVRLMQDEFSETAWNIDALCSILTKDYHSFYKCMEAYLSKKEDNTTQNHYKNLLILTEDSWNALVIKIAVELDEFRFLDFDNTIDLSRFRTEKSIVFIEIQTDYFSALPSVFINQFCRMICKDSNKEIPVRIILDNFPMLYLPNLAKLLNSTKETNVQFSVILQTILQLRATYENNWEKLVNSFEHILAYTCYDNATAGFLSKLAAKWHSNPKLQKTFLKRRLFLSPKTLSIKTPFKKDVFFDLSDKEAILISKDSTIECKLLCKYNTFVG